MTETATTPNDDAEADALRRNLLKRIVDALEVPTSTLDETERTAADGLDGALRDDVKTLLTAVVRIRDAWRRRTCFGYIMVIARGEKRIADNWVRMRVAAEERHRATRAFSPAIGHARLIKPGWV